MSEPSVQLDFSGIGASKCGTTWIHRCLDEHPEICVSRPKELTFLKPGGPPLSRAAFAPHFTHCASERIRGDVTPSHLEHTAVADLFAEHFPDIKLFACLRNPIERYCSAYYFHLQKGEQKFPSLEAKIEAELAAAAAGRVSFDLRKGLYAQNLAAWYERFPAEQIKILIYEDALTQPLAFIQDLYAFLGVDASFVPNAALSEKQHTRVTQRSPHLHAAIARLRRSFKYGALRPLAPLARALGLGALKQHVLKQNVRVERTGTDERALDPELRERLANFYRDDIAQISTLTGRDISRWS